jgi:hypothetical protein
MRGKKIRSGAVSKMTATKLELEMSHRGQFGHAFQIAEKSSVGFGTKEESARNVELFLDFIASSRSSPTLPTPQPRTTSTTLQSIRRFTEAQSPQLASPTSPSDSKKFQLQEVEAQSRSS